MKKIIFILLTAIMFINIAKANTRDFNNWQEEKIEGLNTEKQYRYKFYKEIKKGEYIEPNQETNYQYQDKNDYIYGEYSEYQNDCQEIPNYEISYKKEYEYKKLLPIQYIRILNTSNEILKIKKVKIYNSDVKLKSILQNYINTDFVNMEIHSKGSITYYIDIAVSLKDIKIEVETYNNNTNFEILFGTKTVFNDSTIVSKTNANSSQTIYQYNKNFLIYNNYGESLYSDNVIEDDFTKIISEKTSCKYRSIKTYHYNLEKEYYDENYYTSIDELTRLSDEEKKEYKKDEDNYKIFYRYKESSKEENDNSSQNIKTIDNNEIKLVKTGIEKKYNYKYLIIYILSLILIALILIKKRKKNVD